MATRSERIQKRSNKKQDKAESVRSKEIEKSSKTLNKKE